MKNGNKFVGEFKHGQRDGPGTLTCPSGIKFVGKFKEGKRCGRGREENCKGSYYMGNWNKNRIEGAGLLQLKGEDEVHDWHTQRFVRKDWPAGLRLPSIINFIKEEIKAEKIDRRDYLRELTRPLDEALLQTYVDEVRELNEQEERDRILEAEREKRKELEERREKVRKAREVKKDDK